MVTRRFAAALALGLAGLATGLAGCASNTSTGAASAPSSPASVPASAPASSAPPVTDLPSPSNGKIIVPGRPESGPTETISGTVTAGVEPNCLLLQNDAGSHLLVFSDAAMRTDAPVGAKVTLTGHAEPRMMSTCQQGVPFIVTAVRAS